MIVTAHQPNFLPGRSVVDKVAAADLVIWLDQVEFSKNGWTNRNRLPSQHYLTIPVVHRSRTPIAQVEIAQPEGARALPKIARTIRQEYAQTPRYDDQIASWIERCAYDTSLLVVNAGALRLLLDGLQVRTEQRLQSSLVGVTPAPNVSEWLAHAVDEVGGTVYLSGPSGRRYLDLEAFRRRGVALRFHEHDGPNFSAVHDLYVNGGLD